MKRQLPQPIGYIDTGGGRGQRKKHCIMACPMWVQTRDGEQSVPHQCPSCLLRPSSCTHSSNSNVPNSYCDPSTCFTPSWKAVPFPQHNHTTHKGSTNSFADSKFNSLLARNLHQAATSLIVMLLCFHCLGVPQVQAYANCPPVNLIHRLTMPNGVTMSRYTAAMNHTPECECTTIQEGGWEITCYATSSNEESKSKWGPPSDGGNFDSADYNIDYSVLQTSFFIRYEAARQLKITCDSGAPAFKPSLFQGSSW